jgi:hypothetical protein
VKAYLLVISLLMVPAAAAQDIQVSPARPQPGSPVSLQTTVVGNVSWDFGDGHTASGRSVSHTFPYAGIYRISVYQGGSFAAQSELVVRIPDALYLENLPAANGTPPPEPEAPVVDNSTAPVHRDHGFLHYLGEHPLALILVLGTVVGAAMLGVLYLRKRHGQTAPEEADELPAAPAEAPPPDDSLEDLLPGAEEATEEPAEVPPPPTETVPPAEEADLMSVVRTPAKKEAAAGFDAEAFAQRLGE